MSHFPGQGAEWDKHQIDETFLHVGRPEKGETRRGGFGFSHRDRRQGEQKKTCQMRDAHLTNEKRWKKYVSPTGYMFEKRESKCRITSVPKEPPAAIRLNAFASSSNFIIQILVHPGAGFSMWVFVSPPLILCLIQFIRLTRFKDVWHSGTEACFHLVF